MIRRLSRIRELLRNERGTAVLLALGFMIFLLAMMGFAVDISYQMAATGELERSMEAAALAGAGVGLTTTACCSAMLTETNATDIAIGSRAPGARSGSSRHRTPTARQHASRNAGVAWRNNDAVTIAATDTISRIWAL